MLMLLWGALAWAQETEETSPVAPELEETEAELPEPPGSVTDALTAEPVPDTTGDEAVRYVEIGIGSFFNAGGSFMTGADDNTTAQVIPTSGFAGFSPGFGFGLDIRYRGIVGLEFNLVQSYDRGLANYSINEFEYDYQVDQTALHLPLLLKLGIPSKGVRPHLVVGREWVLPRTSEISPRGEWPTDVTMQAQADAYGLWMFGFGFEFVLPIEKADIRIPLNFRGSLQPGYETDPTVRNSFGFDPSGIVNDITWGTEFQYHAAIQLGVYWYFL